LLFNTRLYPLFDFSLPFLSLYSQGSRRRSVEKEAFLERETEKVVIFYYHGLNNTTSSGGH
jgi:hypothetical protein